MNPWKGLSGLPRCIWVLALSTLVNRLGTLVTFFLALYLVQGRGWRESEAALVLGLYGLGALVASPLSGRLADRLGHRRLLAWSLVSSALVLMLLPWAAPKPLFCALILLWSGLNQAFWPASGALIADLAPPSQRRQAYVLHRLASNLGLAVGPALGGIVAQHSFTALFWIDGLTTLLGAAILVAWVPATPGSPSAGRSLSGWRDRKLLFLLLGLLPVTMVFTQIHASLPLWVSRDLAFGPRIFGLVFTLNTLLILLLEVALNTRLASWRMGRQFAMGACLIAAGFGCTGAARSLPLLALSVAIWSFGEMILLPISSEAVAELAPPDRRGEYMGLYSLSWTFAMTLGPWLGLLAYGGLGAQLFWPACGLLALLSAAILWRFGTRHPEGA